MTAAEEFASRVRSAASLLERSSGSLANGSQRFDDAEAQLAAVFHGSGNESAARVAVSLAEAREKLGDAMSLLTSAADDLRTYAAAALDGRGRSASTPSGAPPDDDLTRPSRSPDPSAVPEGVPEVAPRGSRQLREALAYQDRAALALARAGYRVRRLPRRHGGPSPDFEIEGRAFDCHTPDRQTPADSVRRTLSRKSREQATRFVVSLERSELDAAEIRERLRAMPSRGVREVLVVRNDVVSRIWP